MKTRLTLLGIAAILSIGTLHSVAQEADPAAPPGAPKPRKETITPSAAPLKNSSLSDKLKAAAANLSPSVAEIVRLSDAGNDAAVIQAFVENSTVAYSLRAEEIIYLHDHGIAPSIVTAMIQHGAKLREQAASAQANASFQAAQASALPPSVSTPAPQPVAPTYVTSPTYVYPTYYPSYYPAYYSSYYPSYACSYPSYGYAPYFSFGVGCSRPYYYGRSYGSYCGNYGGAYTVYGGGYRGSACGVGVGFSSSFGSVHAGGHSFAHHR